MMHTHLVIRSDVPDGHRVVVHVFVYGQIWRLVNFSGLQYQHLEKRDMCCILYCWPGLICLICSNISNPRHWALAASYDSLAGVTYRKSNRGDVFFGSLHQEVHPEVHQFLLGRRLLGSGLLKLLVDQDGLHDRAQIPETNRREKKKTNSSTVPWKGSRIQTYI